MSQQKALHVSRQTIQRMQAATKNIDVSQMTAEEYLASVSLEAQRLPEINICDSHFNNSVDGESRDKVDIPVDGSAAMMHYLLSSRTGLERASDLSKIPHNTKEFCETVISDFSSLRSYLENCYLGGVGSKHSERIPLPPMKDLASWHVFCLGEDESVGNVGGYFDDNCGGDSDLDDDESDIKGEEELPLWRINLPMEGYLPSTKLILQMDQVMIRKIISHHLYWIENGWPISKQRGVWIYALLARLDKPLHREDAAMLRNLLKSLCKRRNIESNMQFLGPINVLLAVIGRYFEQASFHELFQ